MQLLGKKVQTFIFQVKASIMKWLEMLGVDLAKKELIL